ncbi:glycosyltransferase [Pseudorhodoplanes sp.]|uniref:glycosyltransferase n=1 Tax=Pseudorhodoplanes sp. TaxID=1934341 RepID=UPI003D0B3885
MYGLRDRFTDEDISEWSTLDTTTYCTLGPTKLGYAPQLGRALMAGNHDLLHQHGLWLAISRQVSAWRHCTNLPVVITPHGMLDSWAISNSRWKKRIAGLIYEDANLKGANCLHALNESELISIRKLGLSNPVAIIPNGVGLPKLDEIPERPSFFYAGDRKTLLFLGRIHPKKGLRELIEAWALFKADAPKLASEWRLMLAGWDDGGHRAILEEMVARQGLSNDVVFPGPQHGDAKAGVFAHADAFILPSYSEGLPVAVLEAWSYGLPVFMTKACNLPEGFEAEAAVEITTIPEDIKRILVAHLDDSALSARGQMGRSLVAQKFSWMRIARMQDELYKWLVRGGSMPPYVNKV